MLHISSKTLTNIQSSPYMIHFFYTPRSITLQAHIIFLNTNEKTKMVACSSRRFLNLRSQRPTRILEFKVER